MTRPITTHDIQMESLTVEYVTPATEKQRHLTALKNEIAYRERELTQLKVRLEQLTRD